MFITGLVLVAQCKQQALDNFILGEGGGGGNLQAKVACQSELFYST